MLGKKRKIRALLIDDDVEFGEMMKSYAEYSSVDLEHHESLIELGSVGGLKGYDLIICDFFLEAFNGSEVAELVEVFFYNTPVVIVSGKAEFTDKKREWPSCVKGVVVKQYRPDMILEKALTMVGLH